MNPVLARNVLIHNEIERISNECVRNNIKLILLKGAALIELFPEYSFEREMEDVDILIEKENYIKFIKILKKLGYSEVPYDPNAMYNENLGLKIDISTKLWYLTDRQNKKIMNQAIRINNFYVLPMQEILRHIIYHMYFEHNFEFKKWNNDVRILIQYGAEIDFRIPTFVRRLMNTKVFYKGHIIKLLVLPWGAKVKYIIEKFFPTDSFLFRRYSNMRNLSVLFPLVLFYRWVRLVYNTIKLTNNLITYLFSKLSLVNS
ncbi:MAG: nucleotidyltransferase family protein [Endomicrobia bacterium]|nr:nucleotidyltransferase family protein [Endomicrobiia bacterium]MDW8055102.1 nucleotidyltransferase family protein [Elusimicrobiota bacterium]